MRSRPAAAHRPDRAEDATDPTTRTGEHCAQALDVRPDEGLASAEAARRLSAHGPNELRSAPREPAWRRFLHQFADPLIYLLLAATAISLIAWAAEGATGLPVDAIVIAGIVVANAILGFTQENRAEDAVAALADMTATHALVLRDGRQADVAAADLVPGDVLLLAEGDAVGADARLLSASSLQVQEASLTGESQATTKDPDPLPEPAAIGDRRNMVFKGTDVVGGVGRAVVVATGMDTEMGRIATLLDETEDEPSPLDQEVDQISRMLGRLVVLIAVAVMVVLAVVNGVTSVADAVEILLLGVALAVAAVPEGLPAILSLVLAVGVRAMARRNAVMKDLRSVETLGSVSVICSDKTGTLTRNEMTLREMVTASGSVVLEGTGYAPEGTVRPIPEDAGAAGEAAVRAEAAAAIEAGALANNAQLARVDGAWEIQGDPTEAAFLVARDKAAAELGLAGDATERLAEVPFSSDRKMMSVLVAGGAGGAHGPGAMFAKGAPDVLLERCTAELRGDREVPLDAGRRAGILAAVEDLSAQGYRTLGTARRSLPSRPGDAAGGVVLDEDDERDLVLLGVAAIIDPPRAEAARAMTQAHRAGIRTVMITGDHPVTAARIAQDLGVAPDDGAAPVRAVTGREIDELDEAALARVAADTSVFARVAPEHKLRIVDALQSDGHRVAMTGDGVNDAPALKSADIGIAMGITGTEVTKQAGEMILGDDNYATIVAAVRQGRVIFDNIKKFMRYLLSSNMGEVATVFLGVLLGSVIGLRDPANPAATVVPLLATQILWINLVTDSGPALAMGVDPEIDDVMARRPRDPGSRIIDGAMWLRILGTGLVMGLVCLAVYDLCLPGGLVDGPAALQRGEAQLATARTTVFTTLVFLQLFNAFNSRSDRGSAFHRLFTNRWLWLSIAFATLAQIAVVEWSVLQAAFGTVALDAAHWLVAAAGGAMVLVYEEIVKLVRRAGGTRHTAQL